MAGRSESINQKHPIEIRKRGDNIMSYKNIISDDEPSALEKLIARLEECEAEKKQMLEINWFYKRYGTCFGFPGLSDRAAVALDNHIGGKSLLQGPYSYSIRGNKDIEIGYLRYRIAKILKNQGFLMTVGNAGQR